MRTRFIAIAAFTAVVATAVVGLSQPAEEIGAEDTGAFGAASQPIADALGPIDAILAPTNAAPTFLQDGDPLRVELAPDAIDDPLAQTPASLAVRLEPSFDTSIAPVSLALAVGEPEASHLWEGPYARQVLPLEGQLPPSTQPGLYDVVVPAVDERAHRALSVHDGWPTTPEIVLLADTQTGDPRAMADGFHGSTGIDPLAPQEADPRVPPDPGPVNESVARTLGVDVVELEASPEDRWGAYRAAIERINTEIQPDLVLFSGDLTFGQAIPGSYHAEYEEAWSLLNGGEGLDGTSYEGIQAPTLLSPGNHDAYVQTGEDGLAFWQAYFGPPAFATTFHNVTFVSLNTYDWSELDRKGASYAVSAWGGQVRDPQLAWLRTTLCEANGGTPVADEQAIAEVGCQEAGDERVVSFSHHSPSWVQDPWKDGHEGVYRTCPCEGTPGLEQVARGFVSFTTTGQAWSGDNRLELRDTLRELDVDLHAAGHTHRDRVARDVGDGTIVETPQHPREGLGHTQLHLVTPQDEASEIAYEQGAQLLREGSGPLYLETTTTASETDAYFGYRSLVWHESPQIFPADALGIPPFETGFAMSDALLDELAREPSHWNASHAELGLFSTPTYLTEADT